MIGSSARDYVLNQGASTVRIFAAAGPTRQGLPTGRCSQAPGSQYDDVGIASPGLAGDQPNLVAFELSVAGYECQVLGARLSSEQPIE